MSKVSKPNTSRAREPARGRGTSRSAAAIEAGADGTLARQSLSAEAEETLNAIRAGQIDALVIQGNDSDSLYAVRSFSEIERTQAALKDAGAARRRSDAQLKALAEERERLFQDMHDGCIQSIYAVGLNLEACMRMVEANPQKASQMIAESTASLNLVMQELRAFITGHKLQLAPGHDLRTEVGKAIQAAANQGLTFTVDIEESAMQALTSEQALHLLQVAREGISNATRHAHARKGHVSLKKRKGIVRLEVSDDGSGFVAKKVNKLGLGLHHIDARARKMGGTARVSSAPNRGTRIVVELGKVR
jgi:signal transduction histidine kinase